MRSNLFTSRRTQKNKAKVMGSRSSAICGRSIKRCRFNDQSMLNCYQRWTPGLRVSTGQREREDEWEGRGGVTEKEKEERRGYGRKELLSKVDFKSPCIHWATWERRWVRKKRRSYTPSHCRGSIGVGVCCGGLQLLVYFAYSTESSLSHTQRKQKKKKQSIVLPLFEN